MVYSNEGCLDTSACYNMTTVGINENVLTNQLSIFPNPTNNIVNIKLSGYSTDVHLTVYDALGKLVYSESNIKVDNIKQIDVSRFNARVYYISINNESIKLTKKFVVTH